MDLLQEFYETTLEALKDAKNDRLWFKTNTKVKRPTWGCFFSMLQFFKYAFRIFFFKKITFCFTAWQIIFRTRRVWKVTEDFAAATSVMSGKVQFVL